MTRNYYCKGFRLRMRRILGTASLCLLLAAMTGAALHYHQYDRSEELALHRARTALLAEQLKLRQLRQVKAEEEASVQTSSPIITVSTADKLLQGGMLSQNSRAWRTCRKVRYIHDLSDLSQTQTAITTPSASEDLRMRFSVGLLQADDLETAAKRGKICVK